MADFSWTISIVGLWLLLSWVEAERLVCLPGDMFHSIRSRHAPDTMFGGSQPFERSAHSVGYQSWTSGFGTGQSSGSATRKFWIIFVEWFWSGLSIEKLKKQMIKNNMVKCLGAHYFPQINRSNSSKVDQCLMSISLRFGFPFEMKGLASIRIITFMFDVQLVIIIFDAHFRLLYLFFTLRSS